MLSRELEQTLHRALALANEHRHEYATLEHLLLALTADKNASADLRERNLDLDGLRHDLIAHIDGPFANLVTNAGSDSKPTVGFQRVLQRASIHAQNSGRAEVTGTDLLASLFTERECYAAQLLERETLPRPGVATFINRDAVWTFTK